AGFLLSLLFCRSVAHLPAFEKLGGAHESAAMLINRANDLRPNVDLGPRPSAQIREQRVYLIGFIAYFTQVLELEAQHKGTVWDQTQGGIGDKGFRVTRCQGKAVVRIL